MPTHVFALDVHEKDDAILEIEKFVIGIGPKEAKELIRRMNQTIRCDFNWGVFTNFQGIYLDDDVEILDGGGSSNTFQWFKNILKDKPTHVLIPVVEHEGGIKDYGDAIVEVEHHSLQYQNCWVTEDSVHWKATYQHSEVEIDTAFISRKILEKIAAGKRLTSKMVDEPNRVLIAIYD